MKHIDVELEIAAGARLEVVSCRVTEGISLVTRAHVVLDAAEDLDLEDAVSTGATLRITVGDVVRAFSLVVTRVGFTGIDASAHRFEAELHAPPWLLRYTSNTRKFRDMSAEDIISKVLTEAGAPFRWETTRKTRTRQYCAQYHESNLDFVTRLLEFEGIYFTIADDGTLVFADRSSASPSVGGGASPLEGAHFELEDVAGALGREAPGVHALRRGAAAASGAATVSDFDWKNPKTSLRKTKVAALDSDLEVYDYPVGYRKPDEGALLAGLRLEALRVPASYVDGESSVAAFAPARLFSFGADAGDAFAGEYLLTRVEHRATRGARAEGGVLAYENAFRAIPRAVPFRPPLVTPRPVVAGDHTAMVRGPAGEEIHTDEHGRFRAQFHWDREATSSDKDSRWIRWMQESATSMSLARVGWEVIVAYAAGDPDRPIGIGRHVNGQMIPTYGQPSNATMMSIKSPTYPGGSTYNEWRMNDAAGAMTMDIHASRDLYTTVMNDRTEQVDNDVTHTNLASYSRAIGGNQAVVIGANSTTKATGKSATVVNGSLATTIAGTEKVDVAASRTEAIQGDDTEAVGSVRMTLDGSFHMPDLKALATSVASSALGAVGKQVGGVAGAAISGGAKGLSGGAAGVLAGAEGAVKGEIGAEVGGAIGGALPAGAAGVVSGLVGSGASGSPKTELDGLLSGLAKSALPSLPGGKAAAGGGGPTPPAMGTSTGPGAASFLGPLGAAPASFAAVSVDSPPAAPSPPSPSGAASALESGAASALTPSALLAACVSGNITRSAGDNMLRLVGGAYVAAALAPITVTAGKVDLETIGGAKLTMACEGDISEQVGTFLAVTVGGALLRKASGDITYASPTSSVNVTSIAKLASQKQVELLGTKISIEAKTSLAFTVGAVSIELTPAAIKLKGKVALTAKDTISTSGLPVDITAKA